MKVGHISELKREVFDILQVISNPPMIILHSLFNLFAGTFITLIRNKNEKFVAGNYFS